MQLDLFITQSEATILNTKITEAKESVRKTQKGVFARMATLLGMVCRNEERYFALREHVERQEKEIKELRDWLESTHHVA